MQTEFKSVPIATIEHNCCLFPRVHHHDVHPVTCSKTVHFNESEQRKKVEEYVFAKLEEYARERSTHLFHLTSFSRVQRRLRHEAKSLSKQFQPSIVSEQKILQWIDETLEKINSSISILSSSSSTSTDFKEFFLTNEIFATQNLNNQWRRLQIQRANTLLSHNHLNDQEILSNYQKHIFESLTPKKFDNDRLILENREQINVDFEYNQAEQFGREYLKQMLENYRQRQHPNLGLIKKIIDCGMKQMIKRPRTDDLRKTSHSMNFLAKAMFIQRSKKAYSMNLKNIADDFMFLRFGQSLTDENNKKTATTERFKSFINRFLNTLSILLHLIKPNSIEPLNSSFSQLNTDVLTDNILSPLVYIDQWTWLIEKWKNALQTFPINLTKHGAFGRLVRTTIGVGIARLYGFAESNESDDLDRKFFQGLQMGYYYGVAYALVDGLQDTQNEQEEKLVDIDPWLIEMENILSGKSFDPRSLPQLPVTPLLLETFHSLVKLTAANSIAEETFTDLALLLRSQRVDKKDLQRTYDQEIDLYIGPLMKSHFTYTATAFMGGVRVIRDCERLWTMPFLGQLTDDCRDFDEDRRDKSITPVTYFAEHRGEIFNPFFVFLMVCEDLYLQSGEEENTGAFLGRRLIRTLRALRNHLHEFLNIFARRSFPDLYKYCLSLENLFDRVSDPEKSIFRYINQFADHYSLNHRKLETFAYDYLPLVEKQLAIQSNHSDPLIRGINHSLKAGGKRLRPLLLLMVAQICHLDIHRVLPLARAIEYLHTSSLIFDDLPAQDNAPLRRGQPTLHMPIESDQSDVPSTLTEGRAQLVAVDLIAYAIQLVTVDLHREGFSYESINRVTAELSQSMNELCRGQFLDLQAARMNKTLTIDQLDHIAHLKTGKAIEIVLICPVILAEKQKSIEHLRELGRLMGILFQMKDDLLDVEGNTAELGKVTYIDQQNQTVTYISLLSIEKVRQRIERKRKQAEVILNELWPEAGTIRDVIRHICERKK